MHVGQKKARTAKFVLFSVSFFFSKQLKNNHVIGFISMVFLLRINRIKFFGQIYVIERQAIIH